MNAPPQPRERRRQERDFSGGAMAFEIKLTNFARGATGATRSLETTGAAAL